MRLFLILSLFAILNVGSAQALEFQALITGDISTKSIVHSGNGLFFAQNMMYRHTVTVYDRSFKLVNTIPDSVELSKYGFPQYSGTYRGSPVEAAFTSDGRYAWVSNYQMYGKGFDKPGDDGARSGDFDRSFVYKINVSTFEIEKIVEVGSVPKFLAIDRSGKLLLVSNWSAKTVTIIDLKIDKVIKEVVVGDFPRGIDFSPDGRYAYVGVMGSYDIAILDLKDFTIDWIKDVGRAPRQIIVSSDGKTLYATINGDGKVAKIDLATKKVLKRIATGDRPRSMVLTPDDKNLFVVNYKSNTVSKVRTSDFVIVDNVNTHPLPIGITYDPETKNVWVACYSGSIMVFRDNKQ